MKSTKAILKAYATADEEYRLYLFLTHRDLRQGFTDIDMAGFRMATGITAASVETGDRGSPRRRVVNRCLGWLKLCR